jgi:16S rRNA (guanine527-N7)-methyltransferase
LPDSAHADSLLAALARYGLELPADQVAQLEKYCRLLWEWNEKLNLTRHTDFEKFVSRDCIDSMELSKLLHAGERVLDVGTGGGVPGIILAIVRPDLKVYLCESIAKKANVVAAIVDQLELPVTVYADRAEHVVPDHHFNALVARAVGPLWKITKWFAGRWNRFDRLLAVKGPKWVEERGEARHRGFMHEVELRRVAQYPMPGTDSESVVLKLWAQGRPEPEPSHSVKIAPPGCNEPNSTSH